MMLGIELEHRRLHVALALELALALAPQRDVGAARDDRDHVAVLVVDGAVRQKTTRRSPRAFTNVFSYSPAGKSGRERGEARDDVGAFRGVDEHVPVVAADDVVLLVVPGHLERARVEVADHAVRVDRREQARDRVVHGVPELDLGAQLGLETVVPKRQPGGRRHGVEELALLVERGVVLDRGDARALVLDELHRAAVRRRRVGRRVPLWVDPARREPCPGGDRSSRATESSSSPQRARERVAERRAVLERDDELGDRDAAQPKQRGDRLPGELALGHEAARARDLDEVAVVGRRHGSTRGSPFPTDRRSARAAAQTSKPDMSGSWMSRRTTSGSSAMTVSTTDAPSGQLADDVESLGLENRARRGAKARMVVDDQRGAGSSARDRGRTPGVCAVGLATPCRRTYVLSILQLSQRGCNARKMVLGSPSTSR